MPHSKTDHVFISYSRRDEAVMRRVVKYLRGQGIKVWVDNEKLTPGTPIWENEIEKAIKGAFAIVVVLSPDAKKSEWVLREITLADQYQKRAFPVLVAGKNEDSIPFRLITRQFVDIREDEIGGLKSLSTAISFYSEELTRLEEERLAAERETAQLKHEREVAEKAAREAEEKAESEKRAREKAELLAKQKSEEKERLAQIKADAAKKGETDQKTEKDKGQISDYPLYKILNFSSLEIQTKGLITALNHYFSTDRRKYIGISAVAVILLAGIGFNVFKSQVPLAEEQNTPTTTTSPTRTSTLTSTSTRTPTPTLTKTPTVVPPTLTATATRTHTATANPTAQSRDGYVNNLESSAILIYGPRSDTLKPNGNNDFDLYRIGGDMKDFIVKITIKNPSPLSVSNWDYRFGFRDEGPNDEYRLSLSSLKDWELYDYVDDQRVNFIQSGNIANLDTSNEGSNTIWLYIQDDYGLLYVNGEYVSELNLSSRQSRGSVWIGTHRYVVDGYPIIYDDFSVWKIP